MMSGSGYVKWLEDIGEEDTPLVGGKTANLGELMKIDMPVPNGFGITVTAYNKFIELTGIKKEISSLLEKANDDISDLNKIKNISDQIKDVIESTEIPQEIQEEIIPSFRKLTSEVEEIDAVAVRSSSVQEDMDTASFAGQYETVLNIKDEKEFLKAVKTCWASLFGPRLIQYRSKMDIGYEEAEIAVTVQQMLDPKCSGVMFTLDPSTGDKNKILIEATWGQGESIVSGSVTPDKVLLKKSTLAIEDMNIGNKAICTVVTEDGGVIEDEVPEEDRERCCIQQREVQHLGELGKEIEKHYGSPQDIEWAVIEGLDFPNNIFILQCRAETVWSQKDEDEKEEDKRSETAKQVASDFSF